MLVLEDMASPLRTKFKMERAKLRDVSDLVKEARAKFGHKRRSSCSVDVSETKRCVRVEVWMFSITLQCISYICMMHNCDLVVKLSNVDQMKSVFNWFCAKIYE